MLDQRSEHALEGVHPDLAAVMMEAANRLPGRFTIVQGLRTEAEEAVNRAKGTSQTTHSRHFKNKQGLGCAVDFAALTNGHIDYAAGHEEAVYGAIAKIILEVAAEKKVPIQWGGQPVGAWTPGKVSHFRDWGHVQLTWQDYP